MRLRLVSLSLVEGLPVREAEDENGDLVFVNPVRRRRGRIQDVKPGEKRVRANLVVLDEQGFADDCGCDFEFWLDELPKGSNLGSEFDLDMKAVK